MGNAGQITRTTDLWADPTDEAALGAAIDEVVRGAWRCSPPGPVGLHPLHLHATLPGALECHGAQAFLHLPPTVIDVPQLAYQPGSDSPAAIVQYLRGHIRDGVWSAGRLAVRWHRDDVGAVMHGRLDADTRAVFVATRRTLPTAVGVDATGTEHRLGRIGAAARAHVERDALRLTHGGGAYTLR